MSRVSGSIFEYNFKKSECDAGKFFDSTGQKSIPSLVPVQNSTASTLICLPGGGVQSNVSSSSTVVSPLIIGSNSVQGLIGSTAYTFEFWLRRNASSTVSALTNIFTMGNLHASSTTSSCQYNVQVTLTALYYAS